MTEEFNLNFQRLKRLIALDLKDETLNKILINKNVNLTELKNHLAILQTKYNLKFNKSVNPPNSNWSSSTLFKTDSDGFKSLISMRSVNIDESGLIANTNIIDIYIIFYEGKNVKLTIDAETFAFLLYA